MSSPENPGRFNRRESQASVLWVSHDPAQARRVSDRRYEISEGHLAARP